MEQKHKSISIRFSVEVEEDIKRFAKEDKRSLNAEVLWILSAYSHHRKEGPRRAQNVQVPSVSE